METSVDKNGVETTTVDVTTPVVITTTPVEVSVAPAAVTEERVGSKFFSLNVNDVIEIVKQALIVGLAAVLTFIAQHIGNIEMGESTLIVIPVVTAALNTIIRWLNDYTKPKVEVKVTN
jgi:hypothetical protein